MSTVKSNPSARVFVSYSHADKAFAERFVKALAAKVPNIWWDQWDLEPGDSIIQKVFESGLRNAAHFIILLSPDSVRSPWVREELDAATVNKLSGLTRIIPIVIRDTDIPTSLRPLLWVDMRTDFTKGIDRIANVIGGLSSRPDAITSHPRQPTLPIAGLSSAATMVGIHLLGTRNNDSGLQSAVLNRDLESALSLGPTALNDAVDELEDAGLLKVVRELGTSPFRFTQVEPTYVLFREFGELLDYDPDADIRLVAAAVASSEKSRTGPILASESGLPPGRVNRAVEYLDDYGLAEVRRTLGTRPFTFHSVQPTYRTKQFIDGGG